MINYGIYPEKKLIIIKVTENFNVERFQSFVAKIRTDSRHDQTFKGICDFRGIEITLGLDEVQQCADEFAKLPGQSLAMWALLVDTPHTTALATLYEDYCKYFHKAKAFSTVKAAGNWLGKDLSNYFQVYY